MSQWGNTKIIEGCTITPLVATDTFDPATGQCLIDELFVAGSSHCPERTNEILTRLNKQYKGEPYSSWL